MRLDPDTNVADGIGQRHHPGGHKGNSLLLRGVVLCETMRQKIPDREADFLSAHRNLGRGVGGVNMGGQGSHERDQKDKDEQYPHLSAKFMSVPCRLLGGET